MSSPSSAELQYSHGLAKLLYNSDPNDVNSMSSRIGTMSNVQSKQIAEVSARQSSEIFNKMKEFSAITALVSQMNEAYNANRYVGNALLGEDDRVTKLNTDIRKEIYKQQQQYLMTVYKRNSYLFRMGFFVWLSVVLSVLAIFATLTVKEMVPGAVTGAMAFVILVVFLFMTFSITVRTGRRRANHWKQFYFDIDVDNRKELTCKRRWALHSDVKAQIYRLIRDIKASTLGMLERDEILAQLNLLWRGQHTTKLPALKESTMQRLRTHYPDLADRHDDVIAAVKADENKERL